MRQHEESNRAQSRRRFIRRALGGGFGVSAAMVAGRSRLSSQGGGRIRAFDHVAVPMRNTDAMVQFYRDLGFTVMEGP